MCTIGWTRSWACSAAFVGRARAVRRLGSAAIDLCYVAAGRMDGFWESDLKPWDIAGGALIVAEAGGSVTDMAGAPFALARRTCPGEQRAVARRDAGGDRGLSEESRNDRLNSCTDIAQADSRKVQLPTTVHASTVDCYCLFIRTRCYHQETVALTGRCFVGAIC